MRSPDDRQSDPEAGHAAVIVEQVLAISREGLAEAIEIQVSADRSTDRVGYAGIDRAFARSAIEPGIGCPSKPVVLTDPCTQVRIATVALAVRIVAESPAVVPETRTAAEDVARS